MKKRSVALILALVIVLGAAVGGVLAWLQDTTDVVENTFTVGKVDIDLDEPTIDSRDFEDVIPGNTYDKDPTVTVIGGSEACYVFVTVDLDDEDAILSYAIAEGWTELEAGVYYQVIAKSATDTVLPVLKDNEVTINGETVTNTSAGATLSFKAYAVQSANVAKGETDAAKAAAAWAVAKQTVAEYGQGA